MHELSVAEALLDRAAGTAREHGAASVETLTVELGEATHVNPDQLRFCLAQLADGTPAEGATVEVERVDARAACDCGWAGEPPTFEGTAAAVPAVRCPECGDRTEFTRGTECRLASIEVPDGSPDRESGEGDGAGPDAADGGTTATDGDATASE